MIKILGLSKSYRAGLRGKEVDAVQDVSLDVAEGEVFGFLGPNGAGKSTTIKIMLDLIRPDAGFVTVDGRCTSSPRVRDGIGYLPEHPYYYDYLSARELLQFGGRVAGLDRRLLDNRIEDLLRCVGLEAAALRPLKSYSKGMVQRAGLAYALVHDPSVVILDEPMSGLDPIGRHIVGNIILDLKRQGKTVFFSSHILSDVERFCDRFAIIIGGKVRLIEDVETVLRNSKTLEEVFMSEVRKLDMEVEG